MNATVFIAIFMMPNCVICVCFCFAFLAPVIWDSKSFYSHFLSSLEEIQMKGCSIHYNEHPHFVSTCT